MNSKITKYAAAAIILLAASYTVAVFDSNSTISTQQPSANLDQVSDSTGKPTQQFQEKFSNVKTLYQAGNIKAITDLLESQDIVVRVIAAEFLAKTTNIDAAQILEKLSTEQPYAQLAEKFKAAAASIRTNIENNSEIENTDTDNNQSITNDSNTITYSTPPAPEKGYFLIKVIDKETKKPITDLNICAQIDGGLEYYKTTNEWFCKVKLTKPEFGYFSVGVQAEGYASVRFVKDIDNRDYVVPLEYTIEMEKGVYIGGYVENEDGQRLKGCKVKIKCERKNTQIDRAYTDTEAYVDANGLWKCNMVPAKFDYLKLTADHSDYVDIEHSIKPDSQDHKLASELKYVVNAKKGIMVGGIIKNEAGQAISGAEVEINCYRRNEDNHLHTFAKGKVITDNNGNWQFGKIPNEKFDRLSIEINHSDYVQTDDSANYNSSEFKLLQAKRLTTIVKKGKVISGIVTDMQGRPIPDADVMFGRDRYNNDFVKIKTDSQGKFLNDKVKPNPYNMQYIQPGEVAVTIAKDGYAPEMMVIKMGSEPEYLEFALEPAYTITGRVVDVNGIPVAGAWVYADQWRQFRVIQWKGSTDSDGRFQWNNAPADEVEFDFGKKGYAYSRDEAISHQQECDIVLYNPLRLYGTVTDAQTGQSIKDFTITKGIDWQRGSNNIYFEESQKKNISNPDGKYEVEFKNDYPAHLLKVEAQGYTSAVSSSFKIEQQNVNYNFELTKATPLDVIVKLPDGSIAENAQVIVDSANQYLHFQNGQFENYNDNVLVVTTDEKGRFNLSSRPENFNLIFIHDEGFLILPGNELDNLQEIVLESWGTIEGYLFKGSDVVADEPIRVYCDSHNSGNTDKNMSKLSYGLSAITDADGFFKVEKVIPQERVQCSWVKKTSNSTRNLLTKHVDVLPGQVTQVELLLQGRPVIGRINIPEETKDKWSAQMTWLSIHSVETGDFSNIYMQIYSKYLPEDFNEMTIRQRDQWGNEFTQSQEYKQCCEEMEKYQKSKTPTNINVRLDDQGNFRAEGVPGGQWKLRGRITSRNTVNNRYEQLGKIDVEFEIPESKQLYTEEAFDIGQVEVKSMEEGLTKLVTGDMCPQFKAETADGEKFTLHDFNGKYLILNFANYLQWSSSEIQMLNDIYAKYKADDMEMLILTFEHSFENIEKLSQKNNIDLPVVYIVRDIFSVDNTELLNIRGAFGITGGSAWFVVGPQGEILKSYIKTEELEDALGEIFVSP